VAAAAARVLGAPLAVDASALASALDPAAAVRARGGPGGAAPEAVDALVAELRSRLDEHAVWCATAARRTATAEAELVAVARTAAGGG
jgi:argininosuccinate lyase